MTNINYLKRNKLYEAHKQFMRIAEGYGYSSPIEEADDQEQDPNDGGQNGGGPMGGGPGGPDMNGGGPGMGGDPGMGGGPGMGGPDGPDMNGGDPGMGGGPGGPDMNGGDPGMGGGPGMGGPDDGGAPDMGGEPDLDIPTDGPGDDIGGDMPPMGDDDSNEEVIDVDDLTDAQQEVNDKVNSVGRDLGKVDNRIEKLLGALEKMEARLEKNNREIQQFKSEFEKRNPTQTEKLNLRSLDSYPFNVRPTDYWKQKGMDSNYEAYFDNQEPTTKEYTITNDDVDHLNDKEMADSFYVDDDLRQDINKIFGLR